MRERALNTNETEQSVGRQTQKAQTCHGRSCRSRCCCCRRCRKSRQQQFWPARPRELRCSCTLSAEGHKRLRSRHPGWQLGGAAPATGHGREAAREGPAAAREPPAPATSLLSVFQTIGLRHGPHVPHDYVVGHGTKPEGRSSWWTKRCPTSPLARRQLRWPTGLD